MSRKIILLTFIRYLNSQKSIEDTTFEATGKHWTQWSQCTSTCGMGISRRQRAKKCIKDLCLETETEERKCNSYCDDLTIFLENLQIYIHASFKESMSAYDANAWCKKQGYMHVQGLPGNVVMGYITQEVYKGNINANVGPFWTGILQKLNDPVV